MVESLNQPRGMISLSLPTIDSLKIHKTEKNNWIYPLW
jgi:hypothetical protein